MWKGRFTEKGRYSLRHVTFDVLRRPQTRRNRCQVSRQIYWGITRETQVSSVCALACLCGDVCARVSGHVPEPTYVYACVQGVLVC